MKSFGYFVLGAVLCFIALSVRDCIGPGGNKPPAPGIDTVWVPGDTVTNVTTITMPVPYLKYRDTGQARWMPVDTQAILEDYFTVKLYQDTLQDDTSALAVLESMVSWNQLHHLTFTLQNRRATKIINVHPPPANNPTNDIYFGGFIGRNAGEFALAPTLSVNLKDKVMITGMYDVINKDIHIGIQRRLFRIKE